MNKNTGDWQYLHLRAVLKFPQRADDQQKLNLKFSFTLTFTEGTSSILDYGLLSALAKAVAALKPKAVASGNYRAGTYSDHLTYRSNTSDFIHYNIIN